MIYCIVYWQQVHSGRLKTGAFWDMLLIYKRNFYIGKIAKSSKSLNCDILRTE